MIKESYITVKSFFGHNINNLFLTHESKSDSVVILFPGANYSCDSPLLYFAREGTLASGCDVLSLEYGYFRTSSFKREFLEHTIKEVSKSIEICLTNSYKNIYFISKSLGTVIAGEISRDLGYDKVDNLFLTPLPNTIPHITNLKSTIVVGSKDEYFSKENIEKINTYPFVDLHIVDNATHSLEIDEDYKGSIEILRNITDLCVEFVSKI